jgi:hypothetical protein
MVRAAKRTSRARQKFGELAEPVSGEASQERDEWIRNTCTAFVTKSSANRGYYRVILELLWPEGHGIPGPHVQDESIREAIDLYRVREAKGKAITPYHDPFRRVRELMGEEGITGIIRCGQVTQLVSLEVGPKRIPRVGLQGLTWDDLLQKYEWKCPVCHRGEPEVSFDRDHKIPRSRGGGDEPENWQPLCFECNNFKSMACRGCTLDCLTCGWAFPETHAPLKIEGDLVTELRQKASQESKSAHDLLNQILRDALKK